MKKLISSDKKTITPAIADKLSKLNTFDRQRMKSGPWISELANFIREGTFLTGHIVIVVLTSDSTATKYLVNGQHQCDAIIVAKKPVEAYVEVWHCDDMNDVADIYAACDNHKSRSISNLVSFQSGVLGLSWPNRISSLVVSAAALKEGMRCAHKKRKVDLLASYMPVGNFINKLFSNGGPTKHIKRSPVVHAMMLTWEKCQRDAEKFWEEVRDGEGLLKTDPSYVLREWLIRTNYAHGIGSGAPYKESATAHEITSKCITAWNAFRGGNKPTVLKYFPSKPIPKPL